MKQLEHPLVSIITPGWNGREFVHRLLDSILAQTYDNMEYIYVDDGSTDGTKDVVLSYKDKFEQQGISFLYIYKENGGLCSAITEGLKHVKGECLCWPEYDDILMPEAMSKRVAYLESHPDCAVVTCDAWITPLENLDKPIGLLSYKNPNRFDRNHFVQLLTGQGKSIFSAICHMIRMDAFDDTHPGRTFYQSKIGAIWQMLLPIYYKYNRGFIDEPLVKWVVREDSISNKSKTEESLRDLLTECYTIRMVTINGIPMPNEDRTIYSTIAAEDTAHSRMYAAMHYRSKNLFYEGYNYYLKNNLQITKDIRFLKWQIDSSFIFWTIRCWHLLRNTVYNFISTIYHYFYE